MKIEASHYDEKVTLEISDDSDATEMFRALCTVFVAIGYHPNNLDDCILEKAEEIENDAKRESEEIEERYTEPEWAEEHIKRVKRIAK